jgi:hypothetical protein
MEMLLETPNLLDLKLLEDRHSRSGMPPLATLIYLNARERPSSHQ